MTTNAQLLDAFQAIAGQLGATGTDEAREALFDLRAQVEVRMLPDRDCCLDGGLQSTCECWAT